MRGGAEVQSLCDSTRCWFKRTCEAKRRGMDASCKTRLTLNARAVDDGRVSTMTANCSFAQSLHVDHSQGHGVIERPPHAMHSSPARPAL